MDIWIGQEKVRKSTKVKYLGIWIVGTKKEEKERIGQARSVFDCLKSRLKPGQLNTLVASQVYWMKIFPKVAYGAQVKAQDSTLLERQCCTMMLPGSYSVLYRGLTYGSCMQNSDGQD